MLLLMIDRPSCPIKLPKFTRPQEIKSTMLKTFWGRTPRPPFAGSSYWIMEEYRLYSGPLVPTRQPTCAHRLVEYLQYSLKKI